MKQVSLKQYVDDSIDSVVSIDWSRAEQLEVEPSGCPDLPPGGSRFYELPEIFSTMKNFRGVEKDFSDYLYQNERLELIRAPSLKLESRPGENAADFSVRINDVIREQKDHAAEKVLKSFGIKRERLERKLESARVKIEKEKSDVTARTTDTIISIGSAVLGAFFGRKVMSTGDYFPHGKRYS